MDRLWRWQRDTTAALVAEQGLTSVTMSRIAKESGIGLATLYKYFPDVESILLAWHERRSPNTSTTSPRSGTKPTAPVNGSKPYRGRSPSSRTTPAGTTTTNSRRSCTGTSRSLRHSSGSSP